MAKTVKVIEDNVEKTFQLPCDDNSVVANSVISSIPTTWISVTDAEHNDQVIPCQSARILRIFCTPTN